VSGVGAGDVVGLEAVDRSQIAIVGGKGAHLGELSRIEGVRVPPGFCVTTSAFRRIVQDAPRLGVWLDQLSVLAPEDRDAIAACSAEMRRILETVAVPDDLAEAIGRAVAQIDERAAYAVRSSATAEDLPTASFAGQQDTYLNVVGIDSILEHVRRCWASLFTERAVTYRLRNGFDQRKITMAVVVQRMVQPEASGILFTADPVTSNRKVASVEASFGLGEALVSGLVDADAYTVREGEIAARTIGTKRMAIHARPGGGTQQDPVDPARQQQAALTEPQVLQLERLGRRIEAHLGCPQDIEWCLVDDRFQIVQSRPITTLFPIPEVSDRTTGDRETRDRETMDRATGDHEPDDHELNDRGSRDGRSPERENRVYVSVGHQQMMTDPMKPLGLSVWQLTTARPMAEAAGRLFVDVTEGLASPTTRAGFLDGFARTDPLIGDALRIVVEREGFLRSLPDDAAARPMVGSAPVAIETDPAIVTELIEDIQRSVDDLKREIQDRTGADLIDFIPANIEEQRVVLFDPRSLQAVLAGMQAAWWLNDHLAEWLGEKNVADTLTQSVPHNVTSEMGLALLDVADAIRPHPQVVAFLQDVDDDGFLEQLPELEGGRVARDAIQAFLEQYGMRCVGEIDITRPRWSERPTTLISLILGNVRNFEPGAGPRRFAQGQQEARDKEQEVLERLRAQPDGDQKADETKAMIDRVRTFAGFREHPKYGMVRRSFLYKQALMREAERLVHAGVLQEAEDISFLRYDELREVVRTNQVDAGLIQRRRQAFRSYESLIPPRVLTSDGEAIVGAYRRDDVPSGALVGLAVSAGTVEGRARVIHDLKEADVEAGDILVTAYTDPSWSPLFVAVAGVVTEVGGLMTHGAVIAREYGLPAVVGVEGATRLIRDGQRIRVHGTQGYVEIVAQVAS